MSVGTVWSCNSHFMALLLSISRAAPGILNESCKVQREQPTILLSCSPLKFICSCTNSSCSIQTGCECGWGLWGIKSWKALSDEYYLSCGSWVMGQATQWLCSTLAPCHFGKFVWLKFGCKCCRMQMEIFLQEARKTWNVCQCSIWKQFGTWNLRTSSHCATFICHLFQKKKSVEMMEQQSLCPPQSSRNSMWVLIWTKDWLLQEAHTGFSMEKDHPGGWRLRPQEHQAMVQNCMMVVHFRICSKALNL